MECGIEEADRDQVVLSLIVCAADFCCYPKNNGEPLGVFIRGHDQICVWRKDGSMIMAQGKSKYVWVDHVLGCCGEVK